MESRKDEAIGYIQCLLLSRDGETYKLSEFLNDFEFEAGYSLPQFGYKTVEDFLRSIPDIVEVITVAEKPCLRLVHQQVLYEKVDPIAPNLKVKPFGKDDNGESKSAAQLDAPSGDPPKSKKKRRRNRKKNRAKKDKPKYEEQKKKEKEITYDPTVTCKRCMKRPSGSVAKIDLHLSSIIFYESDIPRIGLEGQADVGDLIEVSVPEVSTPHRFILHLKEYKFELAKFMGRMMTYYTIYNEKYKVEKCVFKKNEVCAALYGVTRKAREWYRARIVSGGISSSIVYLMDYGLTVEVTRQNLRYLDRFFGDFPAQAINGCLANIRPCPGEDWSKDCSKRFYNLVLDKDLFAHVADTNFEKQWLSVVLFYPDSGDLVSDALVKESAVADCELCEGESFLSVACESKSLGRFIQREDGGSTRRVRSDLGDFGADYIEEKPWFERSNKQLRRMLGYVVSEDESSTGLE